LGSFFTAHENLQTVVREDQKKNKAVDKAVVKKPQSLNQQALDRVLAQRRMEQMEVELRETLIYHSPPELGAVYTDFLAMRKVIQDEQEKARAEQDRIERQREWKRRQLIDSLQDKALYIAAVLFVVVYMVVFAYILVLDRRTRWGF
jgi:hypothetical protein